MEIVGIIHVKEPWLTELRKEQGRVKTFELRLKKGGRYDTWVAGTIVKFWNEKHPRGVLFRVVRKMEYPDLQSALVDLDYRCVMPGVDSFEGVSNEFSSIYTKEMTMVYGETMVAIYVDLVSSL